MSSVKTWKVLVRMKERRIQRQEEAVAEARESVRECEAGLEKARHAEARRQAEFDAARTALLDLYTGARAFTPELALMRKRQIDSSEQDLKQAQHETSTHEQRVATVREELREAQAQLQRLQQQLQTFKDELDKAVRAHELAQEDAQDEDAEETAVARLLAAGRALAEEAA